ncbi:MAG: hypothetical protein AAGM38_05210 [Pseudomonadota bacterium]
MQLIAHRVFEDHRAAEAFDPVCLKGYDGAEFDLRSGADGETFVFHAPFIAPPKGRRRPSKRLDEMCRLLASHEARLKTLILDIKTLGAAAHAAAFVAGGGLEEAGLSEVAPVFLAWHREETELLREAMPNATVLFVIAPIEARRMLSLAPEDLYLTNHFPFLASGRRFQPRRGRYNSHNINVRLLRSGAQMARLAPEAADGVCLQRRLLSPLFVETAQAQGLKIAAFGFRSIAEPRRSGMAEALDYAIISGPKTMAEAVARRRTEARRRVRRKRARVGARRA